MAFGTVVIAPSGANLGFTHSSDFIKQGGQRQDGGEGTEAKEPLVGKEGKKTETFETVDFLFDLASISVHLCSATSDVLLFRM